MRNHDKIKPYGGAARKNVEAKNFPDQAFPAVANDRAADFSGDGQPKPHPAQIVWKPVHNEYIVAGGHAISVDLLKFGGLF